MFVLAYTNEQRHERRWGARDGWTQPADSRGEAIALLPTPTTTQRGTDANLDTRKGAGANLHNVVVKLLLNGIAHANRWGEYAEAIARHEQVFGRPAPDPTEPGPKGNPRLSAAFVEWMMMLPAGWVTDVPGITRNQAIKALGNGVVPPQAAAALRLMLDRMTLT